MQPYWQVYNGDTTQTIYQGDALEVLRGLPSESVHCCITSPPYWGLRDYGIEGQIGLEKTPEEYVSKMVRVFREVKRVLRDDGTLWLNLGDSYMGSWGNYAPTGKGGQRAKQVERWKRGAYEGKEDWRPPTSIKHEGIKPKNLVGVPWRVAFALQADGWYLRSDIIWAKPNPMPESVTDRPTRAHEYVFLLAKAKRYFYDAEAIREGDQIRVRRAGGYVDIESAGTSESYTNRAIGLRSRTVVTVGRNKRSVWTIATEPFPEAHFATFPTALVEPCILAGTSPQACPRCGAPWGRVVKRDVHGEQGSTLRNIVRRQTVGWRPTCSCSDNDGSGRCVVLDPFVGSGTTLLVAQRLGRSGIGIELNPDYCAMASRRIDRERRSGSWCDDADK